MNARTPVQYADDLASWRRDTPAPASGGARLDLELESLRGLSRVRRTVRQYLHDSLGVDADTELPPAVADVVDEALLVVDELASNALRHGLPPADLHLADLGSCWLVAVTDAAPDHHPTPARDRPAGQGGYGLYVVADLALAHGVHYDLAGKTVWCRLRKA